MRRAARLIAKLQPIGRAHINRLRALEQPSEDKKAIADFLTPTPQVIDKLAKARSPLEQGAIVGALGALQQTRPLDDQAPAAASSYGFKTCGSVLSGAE